MQSTGNYPDFEEQIEVLAGTLKRFNNHLLEINNGI